MVYLLNDFSRMSTLQQCATASLTDFRGCIDLNKYAFQRTVGLTNSLSKPQNQVVSILSVFAYILSSSTSHIERLDDQILQHSTFDLVWPLKIIRKPLQKWTLQPNPHIEWYLKTFARSWSHVRSYQRKISTNIVVREDLSRVFEYDSMYGAWHDDLSNNFIRSDRVWRKIFSSGIAYIQSVNFKVWWSASPTWGSSDLIHWFQ